MHYRIILEGNCTDLRLTSRIVDTLTFCAQIHLFYLHQRHKLYTLNTFIFVYTSSLELQVVALIKYAKGCWK